MEHTPDYLQKQLGRTAPVAEENENSSVTYIRKSGKAAMLSCLLRSGEAVALPYAHLNRLRCTPDHDITLDFTHYRVTFRGQRLERLYELLLEYRVTRVREVSPLLEETQPDSPIVEHITITEQK